MGTPVRTDDVIRAIGSVQPAMKRRFGANACIVATRVAVDVLRQFAVRAEPLAVHAEVFNARASEHVAAGQPELTFSDPAAWSAQLGFTGAPQEDDVLDLHVVAVVERRLLLDLTLDQCQAPEHGVSLSPGIFYGLPRDFVKRGRCSYPVTGGCTVVYEAHPEEKSYLAAPDWTDRKRRQPFVDAAVRAVPRP